MKLKLILLVACSIFSSEIVSANIFQNIGTLAAQLIQLFSGGLNYIDKGQDFSAHELPDYTPKNGQQFDFIIVGAGSAGCVLASRLTEIPDVNVLLIEAGGPENLIMDIPLIAPFLEFSNDLNYRYLAEPSDKYCRIFENSQCTWPMARVVGGNSAFNLMIATRGNRKDYDEWAQITNDDSWSYENMLYYFKKLETFNSNELPPNKLRNYDGPMRISIQSPRIPVVNSFLQAAGELGFSVGGDQNAENQTGFHFMQSTVKNGERWSVNRGYLHPVRSRRNLFLTHRSHVNKILIDPKTKTAYGVQFQKKSQTIEVYARKEVIVSGGTFESPKLLMLSGIGPAKHLNDFGIKVLKNAPGVGQNLMDHPTHTALVFTIDKPVGYITSRILNPLNPHLSNYLNHRTGPLADTGTNAIGWLDVDDPDSLEDKPNMELVFSAATFVMDSIIHKIIKISDDYWRKYLSPILEHDSFQVFPIVMQPKSRGSVFLRSTNPYDKPKIIANLFTHPEDIRVMIKGIRLAIKMSKTKAMERWGTRFYDKIAPGCENYEYDSDEYWKCVIEIFSVTTNHHCGSNKMGSRNDPYAVVDSNLKVIGINKLRVIDASVIPMIPRAHINLPTIAIAEKVSDVIKEEWGYIRIVRES
ncbi:hypothetical protein QAD02_006888 [Eretmocerus hayati]|uniref:Uncharacterized protein n=1 Tax=Eretmocerus hayati TaxID=131215 RepID=A0ACC2N2H8_9HYME|nr:hypothetical protein QAD02_006888 [Eretmocerus hayati]